MIAANNATTTAHTPPTAARDENHSFIAGARAKPERPFRAYAFPLRFFSFRYLFTFLSLTYAGTIIQICWHLASLLTAPPIAAAGGNSDQNGHSSALTSPR